MSCQTLTVDLTQNARPAGAVAMNPLPIGSGLCRWFELSPPIVGSRNLVTISIGNNLVTIGGDNLVTIG